MRKTIYILHGPNLNLLGTREPDIYGTVTFESFLSTLQSKFPLVDVRYYQSNHEGDIIDKLHQVGFEDVGIVLNAAALTHYSYAIADAIKAVTAPVVEVHISDIYAREDFRKVSVTGENCVKIISGKGLDGYVEAVETLLAHNK